MSDMALPKPGKGTSGTLQLRFFRKLVVMKNVPFDGVPVSLGNACSQLLKVPLQGFSNTPAQ
jgi:hypothetical protein